MSDRLNVVIVGAGRMAREHIRAFSDLPGVCIAGITSRTLDRAQALADEFGIRVVCKSLSDLYERTRAQLAVVTVSAESMCEVACQCFAFDWDTLLEKPPGYTVVEAQTIQTAARKSSSRVWVALNRRFLSSTRAALRDLKRRTGPRHIQVHDQIDRNFTASFGHPSQIIDNLMFFSSIHLIDYFRVFGRGKIESVRPVLSWSASQPWLAGAALEFESGDTGLYQAVWDGPGPWAVAVNTPEVRWEMRPLEHASYQLAGDRVAVDAELGVYDRRFKPGFRMQAEQVIDAVLGRSSEAPTLDDAVQTMQLIRAIYFSGRDRDAAQEFVQSNHFGRG
jgi:predicted dehydrogenase